MKKILSLFLASLMLLSLFTVAPVFAATSQATTDGGTLWYKWDFESGVRDTINTQATSALAPVAVVDSDAGNVGKIQWYTGAAANIAVFPTSGVKDAGDRYAVAEFDFKKDTTSGSCYFRWRDTAANANRGVFLWDKTSTNGWVHLVIVTDSVANASGKYDVSVYSVDNGVYTKLSNPTYPTVTTNVFGEFRIEIGKAEDDIIYIDNLELKTYKNFYESVNAAQSVEAISGVIEKYSALGMANMPVDYDYLTTAKKQEVLQSLLNQNFVSDSAVTDAVSTAISDLIIVKEYFDWNFEDGTKLDSVNSEPFMESFSSTEEEISVTTDPVNAGNNVAVYNFETGHDILVFTDVLDNANSNGEFDYLTFDFKLYGASNKKFPVYQDLRKKNGASGVAYYTVKDNYTQNMWHTFKSVINIPDNIVKVYKSEDGVWTLEREFNLIADYGFHRFGFTRAGGTQTMYIDDFKVTGYKSVVTEVNEASVNGVSAALETADEIGIVDLPAAYFAMDDSAKSTFAQSIKAKTYTSADEIRDAIKIYFSEDDLVVLDSSNDSEGNLSTLKLYVKKAGVNLATSEIFVATYVNEELKGLTQCPQTAAITTGSVINLSGLLLDVDSSTAAKVIIVNNTADLTPAVKTLNLK